MRLIENPAAENDPFMKAILKEEQVDEMRRVWLLYGYVNGHIFHLLLLISCFPWLDRRIFITYTMRIFLSLNCVSVAKLRYQYFLNPLAVFWKICYIGITECRQMHII